MPNNNEEEKTEIGIICGNCGAPMGETDAYCPYCGIMNYNGAEKEYFEQLEGIKDKLEDASDYTKTHDASTAKKGLGVIKIIAIATIAVVILLKAYMGYIDSL